LNPKKNTLIYSLISSFSLPQFFIYHLAQRMPLIFHTKSTENTDKKCLVRRVGMGETNVNNTHNFIHKSSFLKHGLTRLGGFFRFTSKTLCVDLDKSHKSAESA